ncbi:MAG: TRAP transporter large permease subunit, partial [Sphingomonadaceae bacterium]
ISPPVGFNLFVLKSVVPGVNLNDVSKGAMIFVIPMLGAIAIQTIIPEIALFQPRLLLSK